MKIFDIVNNFIKKNKGLSSLYIISVIVAYTIKDVVIPDIFGKMFEQKNRIDQKKFLFIFGLIFGSLLIYNIFFVLMDKSISHLVPKFSTYANNLIYKLILERYSEDYQEVKMGETMTNLILLPGNLKDFFIEIVNLYFPSILVITIINLYYYFLNWQIGLIITGSILVSAIILYFTMKRTTKYSHDRHIIYEESNEYTSDRLNNILNILSAGKNQREIVEREKIMDKYEKVYRNNMLQNGTISSILIGLNSFSLLVVFGYSFYLYKNKKIGISKMITILVILLMYLSNILYVSSDIPILVHYFGFFQSADQFLDGINFDKKKENNRKVKRFNNGNIICKNITYQFENGYKVLDRINITFKKGVINGIDGKSGRGKTTLINLLLRLHKLTSGLILIGGVDISDIPIEKLRENMALVTQKPKLFNESIYYNILYRNPKLSIKEVNKKIREYGLQQVFADVDLSRKAGVNGDNLSGGQKQIVIILRAILNNTPIIIMDEPTASIDVYHKKYIVNLIKKLKSKGKTIIVISHDPELQAIYENKIRL